MGHDYRPLEVTARLDRDFTRKDAVRTAHVPVTLMPDGWARFIEYHGSAHIHAYTRADGILRIPAGVESLKKGEEVRIVIPGSPRLANGLR